MTVQIGLLGTGFIAGVHTKNCKKRDDCQIVAVADCSLGLAAEFCKKNDLIATPYGDFGEMVKKEKLDAIVFCIPPFAHNGYVEETARQGIHCFIEKPIAISSSKAKVMVDAVAEAGIISQVGFHYRFKKSVRKVKELICSGDAGVPLLFTGRYWTNSSGSTWWRNKEKSGGQIFEQTCHMYDLARHFLGETNNAIGMIDNQCHNDREGYTIEDISAGIVTFKNSGTAVITSSNCALPQRFIGDFRLVCENCVLDFQSTGDWRDMDQGHLYFHDTKDVVKKETITEDSDVYADEMDHFITAIKNGKQTEVPATEGIQTIALVEKVIESNCVAMSSKEDAIV